MSAMNTSIPIPLKSMKRGGCLRQPLSRASFDVVHWVFCLLLTISMGAPAFQARAAASQQKGGGASLKSIEQHVPLEYPADAVPAGLARLEDKVKLAEFQSTIPDLVRFVKENPDSPRGHYDLGYVYFRIHKFGDSIHELSKSLELNVNDAQAHKILGLDCVAVGRYDLAEVELQQAARLEPNSAEIHYFLGRLYYTRTVYPLALKEYQAALRLDPSYMKAYYNLGLVTEILGRNKEAVQNYLTASRLNKQQGLNSPWPDEYLSAYYNRQEKPELAIEYARKAVAIDADCDLAYFQIAKALQYQSKWKECEQAARKAIEINSRTPDYFYVLSQALRRQGKEAESLEALKRFEQLHQTEETESERWQRARSQAAREAKITSEK